MIHRMRKSTRVRRGPPRRLALLLVLLGLAACGGTPVATIPPVAPTIDSTAAPTVAAITTRPPTQAATPARTTTSATPRATATATRTAATTPARTPATRAATTAEATASVGLAFGGQPEFARVGLAGESLTTVVAAGREAKTLYAGGKGVWRSLDAGATWTQMRTAEEAPVVSAIVVAPSDPDVIYVGVSQGCGKGGKLPGYVTTNGGESWRTIGQNIGGLIVDPLDAKNVYAVDCTGVRRSTDAGTAWETLATAAVPDYTPTLIAMAPNSPKTIYVAYANESGLIKVRRTTNGGTAWQEATPTGEITGALALTVAPTSGDTAFLTTTVGSFETKDGGAKWTLVDGDGLEATTPNRPPANSPQGFQLTSTILIDPSQPSILWLGTGAGKTAGIGIFRSRDGGATWKRTGSGLENRFVRDLALTIARTTSTLYVATDDGIWMLTTRY